MGQASHLYELWGQNALIFYSLCLPLCHTHTLLLSAHLIVTATVRTWRPVWPTDPSMPRHAFNLPILVSAGSFCSFWSQGALLEGVWVQAQLQWPWCNQMGAVHWPLWHLRDSLLKFSPAAQQTDHFSLPSILLRFFLLPLPTLSLSPPFNPYSFSHTPPTLLHHHPHPFLTRCWRLNLQR